LLTTFSRDFEVAVVKELASSTLAAGYNYMKCSHRTDAAEKCGKTGDYYESLICPRPNTDPTLVCQVSRWYFSDIAPHEIEMVAVKSIEAFGHLHGLQFRLKDMLQEMYDNYEKHGNNFPEPDWGFNSLYSPRSPSGFHLPVCMHDGQSFAEFKFQRPWWHNWDFPAICGNHGADETADFMRGLGLEPGSQKHERGDCTFSDRIPRVSALVRGPINPVLTS
jgi:hypothetical protein